jgi:type IV pilus assembly protein PilV
MRQPTAAICNSKGLTLIEFLVALVILMVGMLGLLQTVNYAIVHNMTSQLRQEAVMAADERLQLEMARRYDDLAADALAGVPVDVAVQRIVNGRPYQFDLEINYTQLTDRTVNINIQTTWDYKNVSYNHGVSSLVSQYQ